MSRGERTHPGGVFLWKSCICLYLSRPFLLGKCCTGPTQGPQRQLKGPGHSCLVLHTCEWAGVTCSVLSEQNRSSCGQTDDDKRT